MNNEKVIRFGLIEGTAIVKAKMAVYDQQSPGDAQPFARNRSVADHLAVVANKVEARHLTGESEPRTACLALLDGNKEVSIVKCGAHGCWVGHRGQAIRVPAFRTRRVFGLPMSVIGVGGCIVAGEARINSKIKGVLCERRTC